MRATFKNFGAIKQAALDVGDLTILTGRNNTGKTYVTYAIYGYLRNWRDLKPTFKLGAHSQTFFAKRELFIDLATMGDAMTSFLHQSSTKQFSSSLRRFFGAEEKDKLFEEAVFEWELPDFKADFSRGFKADAKDLLVMRDAQSSLTKLMMAPQGAEWTHSSAMFDFRVGRALVDAYYGHVMPRPVILTSERTGISLFSKELDTQKNVLVDMLKNSGDRQITPMELVRQMAARYARPIQDNIDTARDFALIAKQDSLLLEGHPELAAAFLKLAGGSYKVGVGKEPHFTPSVKIKKKGSLPLYLGSSSVRSLMSLGTYLQHQAAKGDMLIIDEPEMNLHPEGQRQLARVLALLVNAGVKVFVTTHSDYLVREVHHLIKLHADFPGKAKTLKKLRYAEKELLKPSKVRLYVAENHTLSPVEVGANGFSRSTFDEVLQEMNAVEDAVMLAKEGLADA